MTAETRRPGAENLKLVEVAADPASAADRISVYGKDVSGTTQLFAIDSAGGVNQLTPVATVLQADVFGTGIDGNVTLGAGTTTLTRTMFYNNLTIPAGSTLNPDGFAVFVKNTLSCDGVISRDGNVGLAAGTGGTGLTSASRPLPGSIGGGAGGGIIGGAPGGNANPTVEAYVYAGTGGAGGGTNAPSAGGAGGTCTPQTDLHGGMSWFWPAVVARYPDNSTWVLGPGGGGGGGVGGASNNGGGGGSGGGYMVVSARLLTGGGTLRARGGAGGPGNTAGTGPTGGGGGGMGGIIVLQFQSGALTLQVTGGAGGAPFNGAGVGVVGNAGSAGATLLFQV